MIWMMQLEKPEKKDIRVTKKDVEGFVLGLLEAGYMCLDAKGEIEEALLWFKKHNIEVTDD